MSRALLGCALVLLALGVGGLLVAYNQPRTNRTTRWASRAGVLIALGGLANLLPTFIDATPDWVRYAGAP